MTSLLRVIDLDDPCEWAPSSNREAIGGDLAHGSAEVLLGSQQRQWRLCRSCAALARFNRYRSRREVTL